MASTLFTTGTGPFTVTVEGIEPISRIPDNYRKAALREERAAVNQILKIAQLAIQANMEPYKDTSAAMESVRIVPPASNAYLTVTGRVESDLEYMYNIEFGRTAGATMPPPSALVGWIGRHPGFTGTPFVLARAIGERGIPGREPWQKAFDLIQPVADKLIEDAFDRIMASL